MCYEKLEDVNYIDLGQPKSIPLGWVVHSPIKLTQEKIEFQSEF